MSKRQSTIPAAPKPPTSFSSNTVVSDTASLTGTKLISIRGDTIIHPRAKIISTIAPVSIGSYSIISERGTVGLQSVSNDQPEGVVIEDYVIIEVGAVVEAKRVGEGSVIEINAKVGKGAVVGKVRMPP
jgi:dynactin-6